MNLSNEFLIISLLFFFVSFLYSSVGFGGGSSYISILIIFGFSYELIPLISLPCNIVVVSIVLLFHRKNGYLDISKTLPFVLGSIPLAFFGGVIPVSKTTFSLVLGISLLIASIRLIIIKESQIYNNDEKDGHIFNNNIFKFVVGSLIGFISGVSGIGGGIFLSPILYLIKFGNPREIISASSLFIFVNSFSGIIGQLVKTKEVTISPLFILILIFSVMLGGILGSLTSLNFLSKKTIKITTGLLVLYAGIKILLG
ncbi:MAG: sulfite exporter TauE/SafE family protein [Leptospiraceae bacterium]|nr:sulfite exporter TauE/SafE family protein [Leptospiraceae bacterium]